MNYSREELILFFKENGLHVLAEDSLYDSAGNIPSWHVENRGKIKPKVVFTFTY